MARRIVTAREQVEMLGPWLREAMPWYHNTGADLAPGDEIVPAAEGGHKSRWDFLDDYDPNVVYVSKEDRDEDARFDLGPHRYEVEPMGRPGRDPGSFYGRDFPHDWADEESELPSGYGYAAPRARVVRKLPPHTLAGRDSDLQDYRTERHRQEVNLEGLTGGHPADIADHFARGGQPLITYKDWMRGKSIGEGERADREGPVGHEVYEPDPSAWGDAPAWATASRRVEARPWRSQPGDPTYVVPTQDLQQHRQFNPAIETPEQMHNSLWTKPYDDKDEPYRKDRSHPWSSGGGSEKTSEEDLVGAFESGARLPPTEILTNGAYAKLTDGNHRVEVADMLGQPALESYIHYDPHEPDSFLGNPVDPHSTLGKHIDKLVQTHPYEPIDGGPTTDHVFRKHPETGRWQRGQMVDWEPHYHNDPTGFRKPHNPPGEAHFDVDFGNGPERIHERLLHARLIHEAMADTAPWHPHIMSVGEYKHSDDHGEGEYLIRVPDETEFSGGRVVGRMYYEYMGPNFYIHSLSVNPRLQGKGAAQALVERAMKDYPHHKINPGETTGQGSGLTNRLMETIPGAQSKVDPDWRHMPLPERNQESYLRDQQGYWDRRSENWDDFSQTDTGKQFTSRHLAAVTQDLVNNLHGEFLDWAEQQGRDDPYENFSPNANNGRGPIGNWINVEDFLKDKYPAAHRGHMLGLENAGRVLKDIANPPIDSWSGEKVYDDTPYETGPGAMAQHGYDPKEVAAGMLLLHNQSHPFRGDMLQEDQDRLNDIFDKRQQMQRNYEQRQPMKVGCSWPA